MIEVVVGVIVRFRLRIMMKDIIIDHHCRNIILELISQNCAHLFIYAPSIGINSS